MEEETQCRGGGGRRGQVRVSVLGGEGQGWLRRGRDGGGGGRGGEGEGWWLGEGVVGLAVVGS